MRLVLVAVLTALTSVGVGAQDRTELNVVYGMYSGLALLGDIYHPNAPNGHGVVLVGGSAVSAPLSLNSTALKDAADHSLTNALTNSGYLVFAVNHRAAPRFQYPAAVEDVQRAVRFLRANAGKYRINPDRIGAVGSSSGGHLVGMLGTLDGKGFTSYGSAPPTECKGSSRSRLLRAI